jgi:hypothetical protein
VTIWQQWLGWIENTGIAVTIRESLWLYPTLEIVHIIGFVVLVGAAAMFDMRLLGLSGWLSVDGAARHLLRWSRASLLVVVPSGVLLFISDATEIWANPAFRVKLVLLGGAGLNAYVFHRWSFTTVGEWNHGTPTPARAKVAAWISLVLWTGIIASGRLIAYL